MDYVSLEHFVTARAFIVLHEMGHILYRHHGGRTSAESIRNEQQADRFAIDVMKRVPLLPLGMLDYFVADAHWSGSATNPGATHPMSGERVRALAGAVDNFVLAAALREFGQRLDDPDIRTGFVATGVAGDLSALGPRRPGELPHAGARSRAAGSQPFDGDYRGEVIQFLDPGAMPAEFALERHGESVTGRFTVGLGFFTIKAGRVVGNKVYFDWEFGPSYGHGVLESNVPGRFTGTWGYREARSGAGTLAGSASATTAAVQRLGR